MDTLVYVESRAGKIRPAGLEAVTCARKLADKAGGKLTALLIGKSLEELAGVVEEYGPDQILTAEHDDLEGYSPEGYREAVLAAVEKTGAKLVVMAASVLGRDLAPCVNARLDGGLLPDCISVEYNEGKLSVTRPVYAGRCIMTIEATGYPVVLSLRPKAFTANKRENSKAEKNSLDVALEGKIRTKLVETKMESSGKLDVSEADIIVSGGRGMKGPENFHLIEELAGTLGAAVGASRAVVDAGWRPHSEQVGQTGKVVSPSLYIASGISGAIQHLAGMRTSKVIVAINKDPEAPIFKTADYGIVGDALDIMPALNQQIKEVL